MFFIHHGESLLNIALCLALVISCACLSSYYYQTFSKPMFEVNLLIGSTLIAFGLFFFSFILFAWHPYSAVLSGIAGGVIFSIRAS